MSSAGGAVLDGMPTGEPHLPDVPKEYGGRGLNGALLAANLLEKVRVRCLFNCGWEGRWDSREEHMSFGCPRDLLIEVDGGLARVDKGLKVNAEESRELQQERWTLDQEQQRLQQLRAAIKEATKSGLPTPVEHQEHRCRLPHQELGRTALKQKLEELQKSFGKEQSRVSELQKALAVERSQHRATTMEFHRMKAELAVHQQQERMRKKQLTEMEQAEALAAATPQKEDIPQTPMFGEIPSGAGKETYHPHHQIPLWVPKSRTFEGEDGKTWFSSIKALNLEPTLLESRSRMKFPVDATYGVGKSMIPGETLDMDLGAPGTGSHF
eukprot:CAMPEP_0206628634 /NCGR_PEP_ID=MMETSP0325_2-20121206/66618_1 /ASSEMBLY_ACC=CAM_ASM_000347 /TAXON_ID=2866 /ORGANISM="Crypthecodinium cohnii, Strain Seligo" /LENGTH=324 /DNA_ID=CAMNT_0054153387 /DNA_START=162 /DNA_END=1137 /DNA_ORIENTATION=-